MKLAVLSISLCYFSVWGAAVSNAQLVVAHRVASFNAPENTRASFQLAWEQCADAIEGDFYLTRDHRIVCFHDSTTERVSYANYPVAQSTLAELQKLDVGSWKDKQFADQRMPSLSDVLAMVPSDRSIFIEIKAGLSVHVWTVDDLDEAIKLQKMSVDSITTNRPG